MCNILCAHDPGHLNRLHDVDYSEIANKNSHPVLIYPVLSMDPATVTISDALCLHL